MLVLVVLQVLLWAVSQLIHHGLILKTSHGKCLLSGIQKFGRPLQDWVYQLNVKRGRIQGSRSMYSSLREQGVTLCSYWKITPRACSRHKWLVEYCACFIHMSVRVTNPKSHQELGSNSAEFNIAHSEVDCDHRTLPHWHCIDNRTCMKVDCEYTINFHTRLNQLPYKYHFLYNAQCGNSMPVCSCLNTSSGRTNSVNGTVRM